MTHDDADLAAVRETLAARTAGSEESLARTWAAIERHDPVATPAQAARPAGPPRAPARVPVAGRPLAWLAPVAAAAMVVGVALGAGSLLGGGGTTSPAASEEFPRLTEPSQIRFPIDEYHFTTDGYLRFQVAGAYLRDECLRRFGFELSPEEVTGIESFPDFDRKHERLYGVFDRELASQWGYRVADTVVEVALPDQVGSDRQRLPGRDRGLRAAESDELTRLLLGQRGVMDQPEAGEEPPVDVHGEPLPRGGCDGEAQRILTEGAPWETPDFTVTNHDSWVRAHADPRVQAADARWSACMRRAGYDYQSYDEAMGEQYDTEQPTEAEIAEATTNVDCKVETNLIGVLVGVTSQLQEEFIAENWDELQLLKQWLETVDRNSERVLEDADLAD